MFYENWMSYIDDSAKITEIAMPGSHNSCTKGMTFLGKCQRGTLLEQYEYGVRDFCVRIKYKHGKIYAAHGLDTGMRAEKFFASLKEIIDKYDDFFIIDLMPYPNDRFGSLEFKYDGDPAEVDKLIEKYLNPEKYALTDVSGLKNLTIGEIRKYGKKYVIGNEKEIYAYSRNIKMISPWDSTVFGYKPEKFVKECLGYLRNLDSEGFFRLQTQLTPGPGTENGFTKWQASLDRIIRPYFPQITSGIAAEEKLLEKVNIIFGDFMTEDYMKANEILYLNYLKGILKPETADEYLKYIGKKGK